MSDSEHLAALTRDGHLDVDGPTAARRTESSRAAGLRPIERLQLLCDEGSLHVLRTAVSSERMGDKALAGDGVVGGAGRIGGRPVFCYAQDATFAGGSLGVAHADTIALVQKLAARAGHPVIGFIESGGARMQEGVAALNGYARIFRQHVALSGKVPQISVITGTSAGGGSYSPALTDFVIMTEDSSMFLTGPAVVREVTGEDVTASSLGGPRIHERNGVCHFTARTDSDSVLLARTLLGYLPQRAGESPPRADPAGPAGHAPGDCVPLDNRRVYDVHDIIAAVFDAQSILEVAPRWAPNMVTALARLDGSPVGIVANQPRHLGGVIDGPAAEKAARFVDTCNAFGVPLIVLVDTPGFLPGAKQESDGIIRYGSQLLRAFCAASVPRLTVVLRKAFGGAYIAMNSRDIGADMTFAWTRAEIGIMGAEQAVGVVHRRKLATAEDPRELRRRLADDYSARHLGAGNAALAGHVDEVILPAQTRRRLIWALGTLGHHSVVARVNHHDAFARFEPRTAGARAPRGA